MNLPLKQKLQDLKSTLKTIRRTLKQSFKASNTKLDTLKDLSQKAELIIKDIDELSNEGLKKRLKQIKDFILEIEELIKKDSTRNKRKIIIKISWYIFSISCFMIFGLS